MKKIIMLDIDGPIAYGTWHESRVHIADFTIPYPWVQSACDALTKIINTTDAKIVISSDWKYHYTIEQLGKIFKHYGIPNVIIDVTDHIRDEHEHSLYLEKVRAHQIMRWVKNNQNDIQTWVALDDLRLDPFFAEENTNNSFINKENFVWLQGDWSDTTALLYDHVEPIIQFLNK